MRYAVTFDVTVCVDADSEDEAVEIAAENVTADDLCFDDPYVTEID